MAESKMPAKIWITMEDHPASWAGSFRRWHASDLDHGDEYPTYIRADLVEHLVEVLREIAGGLPEKRAVHRLSYSRELAAAAISSYEAGQ
jgi:hypothetical protein